MSRIDPARLVASGLPYATVYQRLARNWPEDRAYAPADMLCVCGCGMPGTVAIGARRYCERTAGVLIGEGKCGA